MNKDLEEQFYKKLVDEADEDGPRIYEPRNIKAILDFIDQHFISRDSVKSLLAELEGMKVKMNVLDDKATDFAIGIRDGFNSALDQAIEKIRALQD